MEHENEPLTKNCSNIRYSEIVLNNAKMRKEVKKVSKLILSSNLPTTPTPVCVVGVSMQRFCNCGKDSLSVKK